MKYKRSNNIARGYAPSPISLSVLHFPNFTLQILYNSTPHSYPAESPTGLMWVVLSLSFLSYPMLDDDDDDAVILWTGPLFKVNQLISFESLLGSNKWQ